MVQHCAGPNELKIFLIDHENVEACNIEPVLTQLRIFTATPDLVRENFSTIELIFDGYNDTPDELWNIPSVRKYVQKLHQAFPYWFHVCSKSGPGLLVVMMCLMPIGETTRDQTVGQSKTMIEPGRLSRLMLELFGAANSLHYLNGLSQKENHTMTMHVNDFLRNTFG